MLLKQRIHTFIFLSNSLHDAILDCTNIEYSRADVHKITKTELHVFIGLGISVSQLQPKTLLAKEKNSLVIEIFLGINPAKCT